MLFKNVPNPLFYDLYIPYKSDTSNAGSSKKLHAIPIMILNKGGVISEGIFNFVPSSYKCTKSLPSTFHFLMVWHLPTLGPKKNWLWHTLSNLYNVKCIPKWNMKKKDCNHPRAANSKNLKTGGKWFCTFVWGCDQIEKIFWDYPIF